MIELKSRVSATYRSDHPVDEDSLLTLFDWGLILENGSKRVTLFFQGDDKKRVCECINHVLNSRSIDATDAIACDDDSLVFSYANRGDPYRKGIAFSYKDISVFINGSEVSDILERLGTT